MTWLIASTPRVLTKNTPTYDVKFSASPVREINLNFGTDAAISILEYIVTHLDIMSARDRIAKNLEHGRTFKEHTQNAKRVTGGAIFRNSYSSMFKTILGVQHEIKDAEHLKREGAYKNNTQEYMDKKQYINEILTLLASKEVDKWSVADLKKMINWKKAEADGVMPARKKNLLVLWDLVWRRPKLTPPKRFEEEMDMDGGVDSEVDDDLYEGNEQHQVISVLI